MLRTRSSERVDKVGVCAVMKMMCCEAVELRRSRYCYSRGVDLCVSRKCEGSWWELGVASDVCDRNGVEQCPAGVCGRDVRRSANTAVSGCHGDAEVAIVAAELVFIRSSERMEQHMLKLFPKVLSLLGWRLWFWRSCRVCDEESSSQLRACLKSCESHYKLTISTPTHIYCAAVFSENHCDVI